MSSKSKTGKGSARLVADVADLPEAPKYHAEYNYPRNFERARLTTTRDMYDKTIENAERWVLSNRLRGLLANQCKYFKAQTEEREEQSGDKDAIRAIWKYGAFQGRNSAAYEKAELFVLGFLQNPDGVTLTSDKDDWLIVFRHPHAASFYEDMELVEDVDDVEEPEEPTRKGLRATGKGKAANKKPT